jgi:hypothetical protein
MQQKLRLLDRQGLIGTARNGMDKQLGAVQVEESAQTLVT